MGACCRETAARSLLRGICCMGPCCKEPAAGSLQQGARFGVPAAWELAARMSFVLVVGRHGPFGMCHVVRTAHRGRGSAWVVDTGRVQSQDHAIVGVPPQGAQTIDGGAITKVFRAMKSRISLELQSTMVDPTTTSARAVHAVRTQQHLHLHNYLPARLWARLESEGVKDNKFRQLAHFMCQSLGLRSPDAKTKRLAAVVVRLVVPH